MNNLNGCIFFSTEKRIPLPHHTLIGAWVPREEILVQPVGALEKCRTEIESIYGLSAFDMYMSGNGGKIQVTADCTDVTHVMHLCKIFAHILEKHLQIRAIISHLQTQEEVHKIMA